MKLIYMGTPEFAVTILEGLLQAGHNVEAVFTQPDRPKGRGKKLQAPPVAEYAKEHDLKLLQPESIKTLEIEELFKSINPDAVIVAAYGRIIPDALLAIPKYGFLNVHASLLPKYRGAAPIQWALRNGDEKTGVCIMQLESGLDEGPVYAREELVIQDDWNKKDLFDALAVLGNECLLKALELLDELEPVPQDAAQATYAPMFAKDDACIDFSDSAKNIVNLQRSLMPDDSIYTFINNKRISFKSVSFSDNIGEKCGTPGMIVDITKKVMSICTGDGILHITEVQPAGKKAMPIQAFLNGNPMKIGEILNRD